MITGIHAMIYSNDAEADRAFFKDVLGLAHVDAGGGWLIFAAPPTEIGVHPAEKEEEHEIHLICDDVAATVKQLKAKGIKVKQPAKDMGFGIFGTILLPGGSEMGIYQPQHPSPLKGAKGGKKMPAKKAAPAPKKAAKAKKPAAKKKSAKAKR